MTVQTPPLVPLPSSVSPLRFSEVAPAVRLLLLAPVQVPPADCAPLTDMLVRVSVKLAPVSCVTFGLVSVKVIVEVPPGAIGLVPNALAMLGRPNTVRVAVFETVPAVGVSVVVTPLAVLGWSPAVLEVMRTVTVQLALTGRVNPLILSDVAPLLRLLLLAPVQVPPAV